MPLPRSRLKRQSARPLGCCVYEDRGSRRTWPLFLESETSQDICFASYVACMEGSPDLRSQLIK